MVYKGICNVGSDYLGLPLEECLVAFDHEPGKGCSYYRQKYYRQKEDDPEHPSLLPKVCGNCIHWVVLETTEVKL